MTVTTKPSPVGEDVPKQPPPQQPPILNTDGTFIVTSPDNVSLQVAEPSEPPAIVDSPHDAADAVQSPGVSGLDDVEVDFPHAELARLDEMINRPRWVVPVLHNGELEILLDAAIGLCKQGLDVKCEACQRFFREGLTTSFIKILTDEAVTGWKLEIHKCILLNSIKLIELCVLKLDQDWFPLLDLLTMVLNPMSRYHMFNASRQSDTVLSGTPEEDIYARPVDPRMPRGWLVDMINRFGALGGFQILLGRFQRNLSVSIIAALIRPFGLCYEVLTTSTVQKYFLPIVDVVSVFMENLTDDELKKETKAESKNDTLSGIINALKCLASRVPKQEDKIKNLELFRLKIILRLLQISSFNGKMNALNEVNKLIANVTYNLHKHGQGELDEWLTADKVAEWISSNNVLSVVLRDSLHQPQYVEKLEKIIRFMIKEKSLSLEDLDKIWDAQDGKHEAIVKNVHELLAKLAWDFTPQQLDHLFECFQGSWGHASKKQREKLLELIRRLAEDDKEGVMAHKVLTLLWNLAQSEDVSTDIMDQALAAHIKILDYSCSQVCSQDRDSQKTKWIAKFVEEVRNDRMVLPALKQIREICQLFSEAPQNYTHMQRTPHMFYRNKVINDFHKQFTIVVLVTDSLTSYMARAKEYAKEHPDADPATVLPDGRFNHNQQVSDRLRFLRFVLKDGQLWLCKPQATDIWTCLAENAVYPSDRESCFRWFTKLMGDEPDLDPEITSEFFQHYILKFEPTLLTESGMNCFERFFRHVNLKEGKLIAKRRGGYLMDDLSLIGVDYLWRVVSVGSEEVAEKAIMLLKDVYTNLGPRLVVNQVEIHEDFLQDCINRLKAMYDTINALERNNDNMPRINLEAQRMIRILTVLRVYITDCDEAYADERAILPLYRASRGKHLSLLVRFPNQGRQVDDIELWSHTNDTVSQLRRNLLNRLKANSMNIKVELYLNGDLIDPNNDRKLVSQIGIRDKTQLTAKLIQVGANNPSTPDSSSGSSTGSLHNMFDGPNLEAENCLPGVLMAHKLQCTHFLFDVSDLGCELEIPMLRDCAREILRCMPTDLQTIDSLRKVCSEVVSQISSTATSPSDRQPHQLPPVLQALFFKQKPTQVWYYLEATYALLMPASQTVTDEVWEFQNHFILSGGVALCLKILTGDTFMSDGDLPTRRSSYLTVLRIAKFVLTVTGYAQVAAVAEACQCEPSAGAAASITVTPAIHSQAVMLQKALTFIPNPQECVLRSTASRLGQALARHATGMMPDQNVVRALQRLAWASSAAVIQLVHAPTEQIHTAVEQLHGAVTSAGGDGDHASPDSEDVSVCREALEVMTICLALCPDAISILYTERAWQTFIIDILLVCRNRMIRQAANEQLGLIVMRCIPGTKLLVYIITLLFTVLSTLAKDHAARSAEYFQLLCRLLGYASQSQISLPTAETLLNNEITWLKKVRDVVMTSGMVQVDDCLLEGHLGITKELVTMQSAQKKFFIGAENGGCSMIKELIDDFVFTASKVLLQCRKNQGDIQHLDQAVPVAQSPVTVMATFELLIGLVTGCLQNLRCLADMLSAMFYAGNEPALTEWEYIPPVGPRPPKGFVGLKNAGATCYMNSVIQQLFMIPAVRDYIRSVEGAADDSIEAEEMDDRLESEPTSDAAIEEDRSSVEKTVVKTDERKDYNIKLLKYFQLMFAHLSCSKLQYYVPKGFWKHFRLQGEPVNLREQHDALEFLNSLVDGLDEALKALGYIPILTRVLGGSFADQKICKDCPHRYSREEPFTVLNIDIRNQQNLLESLEQYVKGDLLEGANAYHCEKCNKKVDTIKRMCIKKLPSMLTIQLKRFDYDWERECAIKFNDYFEFPRQLDMAPYTVNGLAKIEGEIIADENEEGEEKSENSSTKYQLTGVVVHSGQASGGHYFSYILHRSADEPPKWYKFDDGEVSECKMEDDEEMKNQCFGGEYLGEVFDHMLKRISYRRQKRWWNAYILFYEQMNQTEVADEKQLIKTIQELSVSNTRPNPVVKMPAPIERCVRKQNLLFLHNRNQFSAEYFRFMRRLLVCNVPYIQSALADEKLPPDVEELSMITVQLVSKFLFNIGFHTKKILRGPASEWYDALVSHFRHSRNIRLWFVQNILFSKPGLISEYLLESPSNEVRNVFMKTVVFLAHFTLQDGPCPPSLLPAWWSISLEPSHTVSDQILLAVLALLKKEVAEHGRHIAQYFHLFMSYSNLGISEKQQLLNLNVLEMFMVVSLDDGTTPPIKYQYAELSKLYAVVSQLVRCCDVSADCHSSVLDKAVLPNPYGDPALKQPLMKIQQHASDILFGKQNYAKKLIQDCNNIEETTKLLKFCSWENPRFSSTVLCELLWQVAYSCTYELRPYLDLLLQMLLIEDSWQNHRIHNALKGIPDDRDGLFDTILVSKNQYQKRAYQCIKMMVSLFTMCSAATDMLTSNPDLRRKWNGAVEWLHEELERRPYSGNAQYTYNNWSTQAQSNETTNGYFLERTNSARATLTKALALCPEEEAEEPDQQMDEDSPSITRQQPAEPSLSTERDTSVETLQTSLNSELDAVPDSTKAGGSGEADEADVDYDMK